VITYLRLGSFVSIDTSITIVEAKLKVKNKAESDVCKIATMTASCEISVVTWTDQKCDAISLRGNRQGA